MGNCTCNVTDTVCSMFVGSCVVQVLLPVIFLCGLDGEKPTPGMDRIHYLGFKLKMQVGSSVQGAKVPCIQSPAMLGHGSMGHVQQ